MCFEMIKTSEGYMKFAILIFFGALAMVQIESVFAGSDINDKTTLKSCPVGDCFLIAKKRMPANDYSTDEEQKFSKDEDEDKYIYDEDIDEEEPVTEVDQDRMNDEKNKSDIVQQKQSGVAKKRWWQFWK